VWWRLLDLIVVACWSCGRQFIDHVVGHIIGPGARQIVDLLVLQRVRHSPGRERGRC
jgi:hypothetical protein